MSWSSPHCSREGRVQWLVENKNVWLGLDPDNIDHMRRLANLMKRAGLYSKSTGVSDIGLRLGPLLDEAKKIYLEQGK